MEPEPDCCVSGVLASALRLSRLAGVAPLYFAKEKTGWRVSLSSSWSIYGYIMIAITILIVIGTFIKELLIDQEDSIHMQTNTRRLVWIVQLNLTIATSGIAVYESPKQMRCMIACFNHVQKMNSELSKYHRTPPTSLKRKEIVILILWAIINLSLTLTGYMLTIFSSRWNKVQTWIAVMNFFYFYCCWIMLLREIQFIMTTLHVKSVFKAINDSLRTLLHELEVYKMVSLSDRLSDFNKEFLRLNNYVNSSGDLGKSCSGTDTMKKSTISDHKIVRRLSLVYTSMCIIVKNVDRSHGLIVLMTLVSLLLHLICTPYYFITNLLEYNPSQDWASQAVSVAQQPFWCLLHTFSLVMIIEPCHLTHVEMETTRELVSHLMRCTQSIYDPMAVELELFCKHLVLEEVSYKPMKITTMTRGLVVTILGSIVTYLVVIIQL